MGGDDPAQIRSLIEALRICKNTSNYKTALYSGYELTHISDELLSLLDYVKVGPYIENFGPLNKPTTNQRLYKVENGKIKEDITSRFWRKLDENFT